VRIVGSLPGDFQFEGGQVAMGALLRAHAQIDGVLAANYVMALGAIEACKRCDRTAPIVAVNASPDGIKAIRNGRLLASAAFRRHDAGGAGGGGGGAVLRGELVPSTLILPVEIVDGRNCEAWDRPYAARALPDWHRFVAP
jgi:ribose transport system substrate-binding protein